jgi:PAS domain S-box-containing protein
MKVNDLLEGELWGDGLTGRTRILDNSIEELSISDENGVIYLADSAEEKMFDRMGNDLISEQFFSQSLRPPEETGRIGKETNEQLRITGYWEREYIDKEEDGPVIAKSARLIGLEFAGKKYWVRVRGDVTERKKDELEQAYLAAMVESSNDAIIGKTLQGIIASWNKGAEILFGYTATEILGQPITRLIRPEGQEEAADHLEKLRRGERIENFETMRLRKDGTTVDVSVTVSPINDRNGRIIGASEVARDIGKRKQAQVEREQLLLSEEAARAEAQAENNAKDEIISLISHELRSPLNSILGYNRMLRSNPNDAEQVSQTCDVIERGARTQLRLLEDLLDTSRIISGKLRLDLRPTDIVPVLADVLELMRPMAEAKGIDLHAHYDLKPEMVNGDPVRLQQVIGNLIANAIKFTPEGGRVGLCLKRGDNDLRIVVNDTGAGIDPEFLPRIFDRFSQADRSISRSHSGLGLGLALVRHLVEMHGGAVEAASEGVGLGSTFTIKLPLSAQTLYFGMELPALRTEGTIPLPEMATIEGVSVLAVDDQAEAREALASFLSNCGAIVTTVSSGGEALAMLADPPGGNRPDVLICDIAMPGEDGYAVMKRIRMLETARGIRSPQRIPAIALTAMASREDWVRALSAGFNMHVAKPVEPAELVMMIASLNDEQIRRA